MRIHAPVPFRRRIKDASAADGEYRRKTARNEAIAAGGHVVLINSGAGHNARAGWGPYAASKFALRAFAVAVVDRGGPRVVGLPEWLGSAGGAASPG